MIEIVALLKHYVDTYDKQYGIEEYSDETYIEDILYGLGVSLSDDYQFASGFVKFKERLYEKLIKEGIHHDKVG